MIAARVLTSLVAGVIPARNAARVDPVHALKKGSYQALSAREGDTVELRNPAGVEQIEVLEIRYEGAPLV